MVEASGSLCHRSRIWNFIFINSFCEQLWVDDSLGSPSLLGWLDDIQTGNNARFWIELLPKTWNRSGGSLTIPWLLSDVLEGLPLSEHSTSVAHLYISSWTVETMAVFAFQNFSSLYLSFFFPTPAKHPHLSFCNLATRNSLFSWIVMREGASVLEHQYLLHQRGLSSNSEFQLHCFAVSFCWLLFYSLVHWLSNTPPSWLHVVAFRQVYEQPSRISHPPKKKCMSLYWQPPRNTVT